MDGKPLHVHRPHPNHTLKLWAASACPALGTRVCRTHLLLFDQGHPMVVQVRELGQFRPATLQHSKLPGSQQA